MASRSRSHSPVDRPNFTPSGVLGKWQRRKDPIKGIYSSPRDAASPQETWYLFIYKGSKEVGTVPLTEKDHFLIGRDHVCDIETQHLSCSKHHAVLQFRQRDVGIRPYLLDLESANGTTLNGERLQASRFYELRSSDLIRFGGSSRDYVLTLSEIK